jgi:glycosyltransferase involved in cell wall biosynthesis
VYEAMAMGKPIITGDTPAARFLLAHRESSMLVPVADAHAIAKAILELRAHSELRERIALGGRETFLKMATPEVLGKELVSICRELVTEKRDRR